jgi:hypothetical protein
MDYKRKRNTLIILLAVNLLLLYYFFAEPDYFLPAGGPVPENLINLNENIPVYSKLLFPAFSTAFMVYGIIKLLKRYEDFSILMAAAFFIIVCLLNIGYRFY